MQQTYIWQSDTWPNWRYDLEILAQPLSKASLAQGVLLGRLADIGFTIREQAQLAALTQDVVKSSEIEGERFDVIHAHPLENEGHSPDQRGEQEHGISQYSLFVHKKISCLSGHRK